MVIPRYRAAGGGGKDMADGGASESEQVRSKRKPIKLHVALRRPDCVIPHLGKGELHWRDGYSAKELAKHWWRYNSLPPDVKRVLATERLFSDAKLVDAIFERDTRIGDSGRCSQTDLLAILRLREGGLAVMGVEAKVNEPFGKLIGEEYWEGVGGRKMARIERLCRMLGLDLERSATLDLRYQLLHRTAAALYEAENYQTGKAIMLVETFSRDDAHWDDFAAFARALNAKAERMRLSRASIPGTTELWVGWCNSSSATTLSAPS